MGVLKHTGLAVALAACGENQTPQPEPMPQLPECLPNRDGAITAAELPIAFGVTASYYTSTNVTIDNAGTANVWHYGDERASDEVVALGPVTLGAQWYAAEFPSGQFVVDGGSGLDGVYHQNDQALWLDGIASRADNASTRTLVRYADPIPVLRFPVVDGDAFAVTGTITQGTVQGLPFNGQDEVSVDVSGEGTIELPYVHFSPTLRVRTRVLRRPSSGTPLVERRTVIYLFECFGEVARAESAVDERNADFTTAAYLRRFALGVKP